MARQRRIAAPYQIAITPLSSYTLDRFADACHTANVAATNGLISAAELFRLHAHESPSGRVAAFLTAADNSSVPKCRSVPSDTASWNMPHADAYSRAPTFVNSIPTFSS